MVWGAPRYRSQLSIQLWISAQVMISRLWDWISHQALHSVGSLLEIFFLPLPLPLAPHLHACSLKINKILKKKSRQKLLVIIHCTLLFRSRTDSKVCSWVASLSPGDKCTWHFTKMNKQKREIANNDESVPKKQKVIILEVKFQSNMNRVIKEIADNDNVDCCHSRHSRYAERF